MDLLTYFLITIGTILILWTIEFVVGWKIPVWVALKYKKFADKFFDLMLAMLGQSLAHFFFVFITMSLIVGGEIRLSAVVYREAVSELIVLGFIAYVLYTVHVTMQWKLLKNRSCSA